MKYMLAFLMVFLGYFLMAQEDFSQFKKMDTFINASSMYLKKLENLGDVEKKAGTLDYDHNKIIAYVQKNLQFQPYRGLLKGAKGTLADGKGNALDIALLTLKLFRISGYKSYIVHTKISPKQAEELVHGFLQKKTAYQIPQKNSALRTKKISTMMGMDQKSLYSLLTYWKNLENGFLEELREGANTESKKLLEILKKKKFQGTLQFQDLKNILIANTRDHFWVRYWDVSKKTWQDFDLLIQQPKKGKFRKLKNLKQLSSWRYEISFELVLHFMENKTKKKVSLFRLPFFADNINYSQVELVILPEGKTKSKDFHTYLDKKQKFRPRLLVSGKTFGGLPFDMSGKTYKVEKGGMLEAPAKIGRKITGLFGGGFGGSKKKEKSTTLNRIVLTITVKTPEKKRYEYTRTIFDAHKTHYKLLPILSYKALVATYDLPWGEKMRRKLRAVLWNKKLYKSLFKGNVKNLPFRLPNEVSGTLLNFISYRKKVLFQKLAEMARPFQFFYERPHIILEKRQMKVDYKNQATILHAIDIVDNALIFAADKQSFQENPLFLQVFQGVLDTAIESMMLTRFIPSHKSFCAWNILRTARMKGENAFYLPRTTKKDIPYSLDKTILAWDNQDIQAWWEIDVRTGSTIGRISDGAGGAMLEYAIQIWEKAQFICQLSGYASLYSATSKYGPNKLPGQGAADLFSDLCSTAGGTLVRDKLLSYILDLQFKLMQQITSALAGM